MDFYTVSGGTEAVRMVLGNGLYIPSATGGDKGAGTINAQAVYDDNVLLTCYVIEALQEGSVNLATWDARTPDRRDDKGAVTEIRTHEPARRFAERAAMMLDPALYAAEWKVKRHLPSMPSPVEWEAAGKKMATGDLIQRLWETVEVQAVHIDRLLGRIEALEGRVTALGGVTWPCRSPAIQQSGSRNNGPVTSATEAPPGGAGRCTACATGAATAGSGRLAPRRRSTAR